MNKYAVWYVGTEHKYLVKAKTRNKALAKFAGCPSHALIQARKAREGEVLINPANERLTEVHYV